MDHRDPVMDHLDLAMDHQDLAMNHRDLIMDHRDQITDLQLLDLVQILQVQMDLGKVNGYGQKLIINGNLSPLRKIQTIMK